jgi:GMP synthase (glutamine-hydrolysing)
MARTAVAIRHVAFEDLGSFAGILARHRYDVRYVEAGGGLDGPDGTAPLEADLLIVLGGPIGAYDAGAYPFLEREINLLERRLAAGSPTLGICLGAQLMAMALGAAVYPGPAKEIGWSPLTLTEAGERSCLRVFAGGVPSVLHWHGDTFDLPEGAVRLASTPAYANQAFAWGDRALALQFHAEVTARGLEDWYIGHACEIGRTDHVCVARLRAEGISRAEALREPARAMLSDWLDGLDGGRRR